MLKDREREKTWDVKSNLGLLKHSEVRIRRRSEQERGKAREVGSGQIR